MATLCYDLAATSTPLLFVRYTQALPKPWGLLGYFWLFCLTSLGMGGSLQSLAALLEHGLGFEQRRVQAKSERDACRQHCLSALVCAPGLRSQWHMSVTRRRHRSAAKPGGDVFLYLSPLRHSAGAVTQSRVVLTFERRLRLEVRHQHMRGRPTKVSERLAGGQLNRVRRTIQRVQLNHTRAAVPATTDVIE
ncbi:MAG: hypothetical protein ACI841_002911 [Planctomycetota bacterium]